MVGSAGGRTTRVFLNPGASHGHGRGRWAVVEDAVRERVGEFEVEETGAPEELIARLSEAVAQGERRFVAAGGDGTVNLLVNAIMSLPTDADVTLGAVGLGSSNDFHKPFRSEDDIDGIPIRVNFEDVVLRDAIRIEYENESGGHRTRYSLVNASVGVTAEANARFNAPTALIRATRALSVDAAISAAVVTTLATWRDITCEIATDGGDAEMVSVTNLSVYKNPHFGGELRYDLDVGPADGRLGVGLCQGLSKVRTLATLSALRRGRFQGLRGTRAWIAGSVRLDGDRIFALEADGEVVHARAAKFSTALRQVRCCR